MRSPPLSSGRRALGAGWGILLFVGLCAGGYFGVDALHLLPSAPDPVPGQPAPELPPLQSIMGESVLFAIVAFATLILGQVEQRPVGVYGLGGSNRLRLFVHGLASGLVMLSLLVLVLWRADLLIFDRLALVPAAIPTYAVVWATGFVIVALFEETFLRGYLQFTLARGCSAIFRRFTTVARGDRFGFWSAGLILCIVFALGHGHNAGESPFGLLAVGLFGLTFVFSLWRTGSLWWGIGAHTSWNWVQSFLYGVGNSGNMVSHHLLASHPNGPILLSGGATGPEGSLYVLPTLVLLAVAACYAGPRTKRPAIVSNLLETKPP